MSIDNFKRVVDELKIMGVDSIQLVGGEPLMHSQIEQLIDYVVGKFSYINKQSMATQVFIGYGESS